MPAPSSLMAWSIPTPLTHGLSGGVTLILGAGVMTSSFTGDMSIANRILPWYMLSSVANASTSLLIVHRAPRRYRLTFRACTLFQMSNLYFIIRFSLPTAHRLLDVGWCVILLGSIATFTVQSYKHAPTKLSLAVVVSAFGLSTTTLYPLQLAYYGPPWWECVNHVFPHQGMAMVLYIYVTVTWSFALILFLATLWNRRVVDTFTMGACTVGVVCVLIPVSVLTQEMYLPEPASTQKLWLPCPHSDADMASPLVQLLDVSRLARRVFNP